MDQETIRVLLGALDALKSRPKKLDRAFVLTATLDEVDVAYDGAAVAAHIRAVPVTDPVRWRFNRALFDWDFTESADWTDKTERNSHERRALIYSLLDV